MKPVAFDYERPRDLAQALSLIGGAGTKIMAGGQSLGPMLNLRLARPELVVDIRGIEALSAAELQGDRLVLGALVTHAAIEDGAVPDATNGMMRHVAGEIAYRAVRNRGTVGGSVVHADPAADWINALAALGARVRIASAGGSRVEPISGFIRGAFTTGLMPGEILTAVEIPRLSDAAGWGYRKICRKVGEFSEATGVAVVDPARKLSRVVMGAVGGRPLFMIETARVLAEKGPVAAAEAVAAEAVRLAPALDPVSLQTHIVAVQRAIAQVHAA